MVKSQTVSDSFIELDLWLVRDIDILVSFYVQDLIFMIDLSMYDTISERFGNDELNIFCWNVEFDCDVFQVNVWVGKWNSS